MADTQRSAYERVQLARSKDRPNIQDYIDHLFTDFFEQRGDRASMDDGSIVGGIGHAGGPSGDSDRSPQGQNPGGECPLQLRHAPA